MLTLKKIREKKAKLLQEVKDLTDEVGVLSDPTKKAELEKEQAELLALEEKQKQLQAKADKLKASVESKDEDTEEEKKQKQKEYDDALKKADSILNN